jgi:DNA-binding transcriptional ArsR family regulator
MQRPFVHPAISDVTLEGVLYALSDPVRLDIVRRLTAEGCPLNCQAAAPADLPKSSLSFHFQVLREAGLIRSERRGVTVINTPRCEELNKRFPGLMKAILRAAEDPPKSRP